MNQEHFLKSKIRSTAVALPGAFKNTTNRITQALDNFEEKVRSDCKAAGVELPEDLKDRMQASSTAKKDN